MQFPQNGDGTKNGERRNDLLEKMGFPPYVLGTGIRSHFFSMEKGFPTSSFPGVLTNPTLIRHRGPKNIFFTVIHFFARVIRVFR